MPMSPRLLRPRASGTAISHPEALDWATRVTANGGTVSSNTLAAVSTFCAAISLESGLRAAILRLNLFCGNSDASLNAVRTPLYRGASLGGAQLGNAMDTSFNFVASDYQETGSGGGLKGDGSTRYLDTGLLQSQVTPAGNMHLSASATGAETSGVNATFVGQLRFPGTTATWADLFAFNSGVSQRGSRLFTSNIVGVASPGAAEPHILSTRQTTTLQTLYRSGTQAATETSTASGIADPSQFFVFAVRNAATPAAASFTASRMRMYSIGNHVTAAQALAFSNAVIAFNTALGRA
jgi:hypothetical protein